ncbi:MAG: dTDP-4-dehydrorhamnose 3,5-epimerase [Acidiferrobacteraceae bacterium]|nr:dTDP-4-dehydrorhamnose 3,5-epimerase [Acidiferrobacteraceae bacterium]
MKLIGTPLEGVVIIETKVFSDERGSFSEVFNARDFSAVGLPEQFVQDNHSQSSKGVLRGLHYQYPRWQGKLIRVVVGKVFDVAVDIRRSSPTFGQWFGLELSSENHKQLYVPPGFAHGFCTLSSTAELSYKCTALYDPSEDAAVLWNDPDINIDWPVSNPLLSPKDSSAPLLSELPDLSVVK